MTIKFPILLTDRLLLRQFVDDDLENVYKGLSNPDVIRYYGVSYQSLEATRDQMKFFKDLEQNETGAWWAICSLDNTIFYGGGGLSSISHVHKKGEIGCWLIPEFWGKGIMKEALEVICNYGFEKLGLHRIEGFVETENTKCISAMAKVGFQHEGTMKEFEIKNGNFISLAIYASVKTDHNR